MTPLFALGTVKALAAEGKIFLLKTRCVDFFQSHAEAESAAKAVIAGLRERNFAGTRALGTDMADEYGVRFQNAGWYLKITVVSESLTVISLHPLERRIRTNGGWVNP